MGVNDTLKEIEDFAREAERALCDFDDRAVGEYLNKIVLRAQDCRYKLPQKQLVDL